MIRISVPESFALDYLSILHIKSKKSSSRENLTNFYNCLDDISDQLQQEGECELAKILESPEFKTLQKANLDVFEAIDGIHNGSNMSSKELDLLNYQRFLAKEKLQIKFFPNRKSEIKIGYEN